MKIFVLLITSLFLVSCSHHHVKPKHHHHAFEKHCAHSIAEGEFKTMGHDDFKLEHGGTVYYFSTKERKDRFSESLKENIERAERNWSLHDRPQGTN